MTPVKIQKRSTPLTKSSFVSREPAFADFFDLSKGILNLNRFLNGDLENDMNQFPAVNVKDLKNNYEVQLSAPGLEKSYFKITMDKGILTITAEKEEKREEEKEGFISKEFSFNSFSRSMGLHEFINGEEEVKATYKDGVLKLLLKKTKEMEKPTPETIKVS